MTATTLRPSPPGGAAPAPPHTAPERGALVERLDDRVLWPAAAAALLADLGFRLVGPDAPSQKPGMHADTWHLLVALRAAPTERHFDPERVMYYAPVPGGAAVRTLDRGALAAAGTVLEQTALWGHIHVVDRIPVENRFLTFGGDLRVAAVDDDMTVADVASPAPIARWGGHSQGTDGLAEAIGAFFGRLIVPINFVPGAAARIDALPPGVLYRAFLADGLRRAAAAEQHGLEHGGTSPWIASAWLRARGDQDACDRAQRLLRELRLD